MTWMPLELYKKLKVYCIEKDTNMHDVISRALQEYLTKKEEE